MEKIIKAWEQVVAVIICLFLVTLPLWIGVEKFVRIADTNLSRRAISYDLMIYSILLGIIAIAFLFSKVLIRLRVDIRYTNDFRIYGSGPYKAIVATTIVLNIIFWIQIISGNSPSVLGFMCFFCWLIIPLSECIHVNNDYFIVGLKKYEFHQISHVNYAYIRWGLKTGLVVVIEDKRYELIGLSRRAIDFMLQRFKAKNIDVNDLRKS